MRDVLVVGDVVQPKMAVQAKRWMKNAQMMRVQQVRGALGPHEHDTIITTGDFSAALGKRLNTPTPLQSPL